jgi:hypothetical protein
MQNLEIYEHALALLSLTPSEEENSDLMERAPHHLAAFCSEAESMDLWLTDEEGGDTDSSFNRICLPLEARFPLCERLAPVAALYLASLLVLDEDPDLSDRLFSRYCDAVSRICAGLPMQSEEILDRYGFI